MSSIEELRGLDFGHFLAGIKKIGGRGVFDQLLRDEVEVEIREKLQLLVDSNGRCIPPVLGVSRARDENCSFFTVPPSATSYCYTDICAWYKDILPKGSVLLEPAEFEDLAEEAKKVILANRQISNLFERAAFPVPFPQYSFEDYGTALQEFFLPIAERGYKAKFPDRQFKNWRDGELKRQTTPLPNLGSERLFAAMAAGPGMMWVFSHSLQGFSPLAQREAGTVLTGHGLGLAGASEFSLAIGGFPEQMAGSYGTPGYDCSGDSWESPDCSLCFKADDDRLLFGSRGNLEDPGGSDSGALFFLGQPRK